MEKLIPAGGLCRHSGGDYFWAGSLDKEDGGGYHRHPMECSASCLSNYLVYRKSSVWSHIVQSFFFYFLLLIQPRTRDNSLQPICTLLFGTGSLGMPVNCSNQNAGGL
jgi:hypothetical protein